MRSATARVLALSPHVHGVTAPLKATAPGKIITDNDISAAQRTCACYALIDSLPPRSLAAVCGVSKQELDSFTADWVVQHVISYSRTWAASTIYNGIQAWTKLLVYLASIDNDVCPNVHIPALILTEYATMYDAQARNKCLARSQGHVLVRGKKLPQTGATAADSQIDNLGFLVRRFGLQLPYHDVPRFSEGNSVVRNPPQPASAFPLRMVIELEASAVDPNTPIVLRNVTCTIMFCIFSGSQIHQTLQQEWFFEHDSILFGRCADKSGKARRTFTPLGCIMHGDRWFRALLLTLRGAEAGGWIFREFYSPNCDPTNPLAFHCNAPMPNDTILKCLRIVLRKACPYLSRTDALVYTLHSARHVLQEIGKARGEEPTVFGKHCECIAQKCTHLGRLPPLVSHLLLLRHCVLTWYGGQKKSGKRCA